MDTTRLVQTAAILGERFRVATLAAVLGEPALRIHPTLENARHAGVIAPTEDSGVWMFGRALGRDACVNSIEPDELASLQVQVAAALESEPAASAAGIARHQLAATINRAIAGGAVPDDHPMP